MTTCPTCNQSLATPALAFLHERGYCKLPFGLTGSIAELMEAYAEQARAAERELAEGHGKPCYYCGKPVNSFSGRCSLWPVALCHLDNPGVVRWHHTGCVSDRLLRLVELERVLAAERERVAGEYRDAMGFGPGAGEFTPQLVGELYRESLKVERSEAILKERKRVAGVLREARYASDGKQILYTTDQLAQRLGVELKGTP